MGLTFLTFFLRSDKSEKIYKSRKVQHSIWAQTWPAYHQLHCIHTVSMNNRKFDFSQNKNSFKEFHKTFNENENVYTFLK